MATKKRKKRSKFEMSLIKTRLMKHQVKSDLLPLYNHLLVLARDSQKHGHHKRAGIELAQARRLIKYND